MPKFILDALLLLGFLVKLLPYMPNMQCLSNTSKIYSHKKFNLYLFIFNASLIRFGILNISPQKDLKKKNLTKFLARDES